jgi:hypothetical protein
LTAQVIVVSMLQFEPCNERAKAAKVAHSARTLPEGRKSSIIVDCNDVVFGRAPKSVKNGNTATLCQRWVCVSSTHARAKLTDDKSKVPHQECTFAWPALLVCSLVTNGQFQAVLMPLDGANPLAVPVSCLLQSQG